MSKPNLEISKAVLQAAADQARGLAMDAVHKCNSGHLGLPLGAAEAGAALFGHVLHLDPADPKWLNRDRFVLSAGHGSMFLYAWLHLAGFDLPMEELRNFRQLRSRTPGHPESFETPGVECTTGPLGQGVGNAVGMALAGKMAAARYNTADHTIFDYHVFALAGDGCLQEGVAREATAFAGHNGLDNLILLYDSNDVTLDAMANITQSEDTAALFAALGWDVETVDGHDLEAVVHACNEARRNDNGRPKLIILKTLIGRGIPEVAGTAKAHGEGGAKFVDKAREALGLPPEPFHVSNEVRHHFELLKTARAQARAHWNERFDAWAKANPQLAAELSAARGNPPTAEELLKLVPEYPAEGKAATRNSGGEILNHLARGLPHLITGSADLFGSTKNYIRDGGDFSRDNPSGRNIWFGIREHAMGAICNGIAYDGLFRASGATFLVFADYLRPSIRLAALSRLPVTYIFTHDSVGVGEDGPTHQPVETVSGLRLIPNLDVIRPGDAEENSAAFAAAFSRTDGPTLLALTRQDIPHQGIAPAAQRREGTLRGGYVLIRESAALDRIILATGSELQHAVEAARRLGPGTRVVSMPCFERFDRQPASYRDEVLPPSCTNRIAIEAGVTALWWKYVGTAGRVIGIDRFGLSAPGATVMKELGITADSIVNAAV